MGTVVRTDDAGEITVENKSGLTPRQLALLWGEFAQLRKVDPSLAEPVMRFVVDGDGPEILEHLASAPRSGGALGLSVCHPLKMRFDFRDTAWRTFFREEGGYDPPSIMRLGQVFEAASRSARAAGQKLIGLPAWLEILVLQCSTICENVWSSQTASAARADVMEAALIHAGLQPDLLVRAALCAGPDARAKYEAKALTMMRGFDQSIARHPQAVIEALAQPEADRRIYVLEVLDEIKADPALLARAIVEQAVCPQKTVRKAAERLLKKIPQAAAPVLREFVETGSNEQRLPAVKLLWDVEGEAASAFLRARLEKEKSAKIRTAIEELTAKLESAVDVTSSQPAVSTSFPPLAPVELEVPLTSEAREALAKLWRDAFETQQKHAAKNPNYKAPPPLTDAELEEIVHMIEHWRPGKPMVSFDVNAFWMGDKFVRFCARPDLQLVHVLRLGKTAACKGNAHFYDYFVPNALGQYLPGHPSVSLRDVNAVMTALGDEPARLGKLATEGFFWGRSPLLDLPPDQVWPYFAEHLDVLDQTWSGKGDYQDEGRRRAVFRILSMFPRVPPQFARIMWETALGGTKKERPLAQGVVAREPDRMNRILDALRGGRAEQRAVAAEWLAEIGDKSVIPDLRKALDKEKQELAAGAIMNALESLGVSLDEFVSMEGLLKQAKMLVDKGIPKDLAWFDFDNLPKVRWRQGGKPVRKEIIQWMILQSDKLASPEPGPRLRVYTSNFERGDAEELGQYVLESWIAQDTVPPSHEEAHKHAETIANQTAATVANYPQYAGYYPGTRADWYQRAYNEKMNQPVGTAIGNKGILAVAGACCGGRAAAPVERYLKTYYGWRTHQCRALAQMLSWVEHPSAIQLLLSVSNRFRTAGIRKQAEESVAALAERKNWTIDELADRTIPTAGFDDSQTLTLDFGPRQFTAKLDAELDITLLNEEGKPIKSLPEPRQTDDEAKAKAAKKQLSAAKKELDAVVKHQKPRLYEAMCTRRSWLFADFDQFLHRHPIVRHLCTRLVWAMLGGEKRDEVKQTFRPLGDGTFTDANDEPVTLGDEDFICLAHGSLIAADVAKKWNQHLADYEIAPLFEQFREGGGFELTDELKRETSIEQFDGYLIEAFKLRGRLTKLGYTRGPTEDGGWFSTYVKRFPSLKLTATIEFSGNPLPETNRTVALHNLHFSRTAADGESTYASGSLPLGEISSVLLSECFNDLRSVAAEGSGYDAEWEKKIAM